MSCIKLPANFASNNSSLCPQTFDHIAHVNLIWLGFKIILLLVQITLTVFNVWGWENVNVLMHTVAENIPMDP